MGCSQLVYTNITRSGMSGGPVFDRDGDLIAIHGRAEGEAIFNPDTGDMIDIKSGFNLGIPIVIFFPFTVTTDLLGNDSFVISLVAWAHHLLSENQLSSSLAAYQIASWQTSADLSREYPELQAELNMAIAVGLYQQGNREEAFRKAAKAIQLNSRIADREVLMRNLRQEQLLADAQPILDYTTQVLFVDGQWLAVSFNVGKIQYEAGNIDRAIALFQEVIDDSVSTSSERSRMMTLESARIALATAFYAKGDRDLANQSIADYLKFIEANQPLRSLSLNYFWSDRLKSDAEELLASFSW